MATNKLTALVSALTIVSAASLAACASKDSGNSDNGSETGDSNEAAASNAQASSMAYVLFAPVSSIDPSAAASALASAQWWPAGCATRTKDATANVVHIHLNDCTGPFGLLHWNGDITVTFSKGASAGVLHAEAASSDMTVNGHAVTYSAAKDITVNGGQRTVTGTWSWTRETASGATVAHTGQFTTVIDVQSGCRDTNGTAMTTVGNREVDSTIKDYKICRAAGEDECPSGEIDHHHKLSGRTVVVVFNGTNEANVSIAGGKGVEVPLVCGQ